MRWPCFEEEIVQSMLEGTLFFFPNPLLTHHVLILVTLTTQVAPNQFVLVSYQAAASQVANVVFRSFKFLLNSKTKTKTTGVR
jgi:hypothetical protein